MIISVIIPGFLGICIILITFYALSLSQSACQAAAAHCKEKGKNISKLSLQYSLSNKDISSVLVGMNSIRQVPIRCLPSLPCFFDIQAMPFISLFLLWLCMFKIHIMHFEVPTIAFFLNPTVAYFAFNELQSVRPSVWFKVTNSYTFDLEFGTFKYPAT